ncbi:MAG: hypothetical protein CSA72_01395 [Rhodobacterales bacterium]|nr:MAG: hypothetical protein CSA72_01395 [Rhodobacterales bacterium]
MQFTKVLLVGAGLFVLGACQMSDTERGLVGAAGGAVVADATGNDPLIGAAIGGTAGVLCDNAGVCN